MYAQGKRHHAQRAVGDVQFRKHQQPVQVARLLRDQRDAAVGDLFAEDFDLLADDVVDGADDVAAQGRPCVAGQHRRKIAGVDQRDRLPLAGPLNLGDRQHLVARQVLRRQQQPDVQRPQLHFLVVAAEALVLERLDGLRVAGLAGVRGRPHVGAAQLELRHRQEDPHHRLFGEGLLQVDPIKLLAGIDRDQRPVAHPRMAGVELELVIGDRLVAEFELPNPVVVLVVPLLVGLKDFRPVAVGGLKVMGAEEQALGPVYRQVVHLAFPQQRRSSPAARVPAHLEPAADRATAGSLGTNLIGSSFRQDSPVLGQVSAGNQASPALALPFCRPTPYNSPQEQYHASDSAIAFAASHLAGSGASGSATTPARPTGLADRARAGSWPPCWLGCSGGGSSSPPSISPACRSSTTTCWPCPRCGLWPRTSRRSRACRGTDRPSCSRDLQTSQGIATLANRLRGFAAKPRDTLILYLRVYGVSDDGKAWVLCSDYLRSPQGGRCSLADLLGQIQQSPARKKLVILDAGDLACDPRLGLFVNEFPQLLDEEVRRVNDPGLWVLASNRPLEVSRVSDSDKRSAFGYFVTEGLMRRRRPRWRRHDRTGRTGRIRPRKRGCLGEPAERRRRDANPLAAARRRGRRRRAARTGAVAHLGAGPGGQERPGRTNTGCRRRQVRRKQARCAKLDTTKPAANPRNQAAEQVAHLLEEAWRLRDQIEQPSTAAPVTPVDYAPHLWRAYQELLLGYERRYRGGSEYEPAKLADDLRTNILPAAALATGQPLPPAAGRATIISRLADAQQAFLAKFKEEQIDRLAKDPRDLRYLELVRSKNELVFRAADYVRWHAAAEQGSSRKDRLYQPIADFLAQLRTFVDQLEAFERAAAAPSGSDQIAGDLDGLARQAETLQRLRKAIEEEGLYKDAADLIDVATKNPAKKGIAGPIDVLLATPLLPAPLRTRLLHARSGLAATVCRGRPAGLRRRAAAVAGRLE